MRELNFQLKELCKRCHEGSYQTQAARAKVLQQVADQLNALGYPHMQASSLKPKHVSTLVNHWQQQALAIGTIKNRLSVIRWWANKAGRRSAVARSNEHYGIPSRQFVTNVSKATTLDDDSLQKIQEPNIRLSLELQKAFGLRREEALKFCPCYADKGTHVELKPSWTKGGKARSIPVQSDYQRSVLQRAHDIAGHGSMIPPNRNYVQQLRQYERATAQAGLGKMHGLRHRYAQERYRQLTGFPAPAVGGPKSLELTPMQKHKDQIARQIISRELGHERAQIVAIYIGR